MRRYSFIVLLHVAGFALMSVGVYVLAERRLWFCAATLFLLLLLMAVRLYRLQMVQMRMMRGLAESLRHDDRMISFRSPYRNRPMEEMAGELSDAMQGFRTRLLERNEMEAWQKLIRVLTHEIMNSITPILSLSETLSEREMNERNYAVMQQGMKTICRRSKGLLEFVENYRKLTRLPAPVRRPVSVCELLSDLRKLYAADTGLHIRMPAEDMVLHIDRAQVEQVLINLIKNAREACARRDEPDIRVEAAPDLFEKAGPACGSAFLKFARSTAIVHFSAHVQAAHARRIDRRRWHRPSQRPQDPLGSASGSARYGHSFPPRGSLARRRHPEPSPQRERHAHGHDRQRRARGRLDHRTHDERVQRPRGRQLHRRGECA